LNVREDNIPVKTWVVSQKSLAEELGISRATTDKFFTGKPVDYRYFVEISERLGLDWDAIAYIEEDPTIKVEASLPSDSTQEGKSKKKSLGIDWRQICRNMLEAQNQRRLTTNPLTAGDGVAFELDEIYVPLGLVERKQQRRVGGDISPEQGSRVYEPETEDEIVKTFQNEQFFEQVLRPRRSKRIAIIGEPGAGKTTLLQKIAAWVLDNTEDMPIWISLADLQGKSLKEYLLCDWLEAATRKVRVTEEMQEALGELFNSGRMWLLLDGVDEMAVGVGVQGVAPLQLIANQITGWVADSRVVLTCRLNVWDAGKNALEAFETYRNLDFSYGDTHTPDQVGQYIRRWFKGNPELAERLRAELDQPGRERIKDAVKNPLRLALLCRSWALGQGGLPKTKAGLYQQFTEALNEWKQDRFPTTSTQRQELNQALGELAKRAIATEKTKFRLRYRLVCEVLGQPDANLFKLGLQLGWLNQVGVAAEAENQGEKVYAFFHPTFQEYFAAQAIADWHFFLNHTPHDPAQGTYHIFEPSWKEVILLWLGREDVPKEQKEEFIKALVEFEDGCKDFYKYRAYFLAAVGIAEFENCSKADEIVAQVIKWSLGYFKIGKQEWWTFPKPLQEEATATLPETDRSRAIAVLVQLIKSDKEESLRWRAAYSIGKIGSSNPTAIAALMQLIESAKDESTRITRSLAVRSLGKIIGNQTASATLVQLIESAKDESACWRAAESLGKIDPGNPTAIAALVQLINSTDDEVTRRQAAESLGKIDPGNPTAIAALVQLIESTQDEYMRRRAAESLGKIDPDNPTAIAALVQLIESTQDEYIRRRAAESLGKIDPDNPTAIAALVQLINSTGNEVTRRQAADSLGEIGFDNPTAITALVQLIESTHDEYTRGQAAENIGKIGSGNPTAIAALVQLIESTQDEYTCRRAAYSLGKIDSGNSIAVAALVQLTTSTKDDVTRWHTAESLKKILRDEQLPGIITALKDHLSEEIYENDFERFRECYKLIWHCAQNMTYPAFYQIWHN
jgi:HEAT repeat protein/transcriptional regulator with XRE-family HTH domain/energy-coupling factor transporter ATP-binding protein EcfA2